LLAPLAFVLLFSAARCSDSRSTSAAEIQGEVDSICKEVANVREAAFASRVIASEQGPDDFRRYVQGVLDEDLPAAEGVAKSKVLALIGLVPEKTDLRRTVMDLTTKEAAAYYDPKTGRFFLVKKNLPDMFRRITCAHELAHALQDQRFHLRTFVEPRKFSEDEEFARRCLVEGEAQFVSMRWLLGLPGRASAFTDAELAEQMTLSRDMLWKNDFLAGDMKESLKKSLGDAGSDLDEQDKALGAAPLFFRRSLIDPYFIGGTFVAKAKEGKGWAGVDACYEKPPRSSEQILHPEKFLGEKPDEPVAVSMPGEKEAEDADTLGEFAIECLLEEGLRAAGKGRAEARKAAEKAAAGWGGDRYALRKDGRLVWRIVWDSPQDAKEFQEAFSQVLKARFPRSEDFEALLIKGADGKGIDPAASTIGSGFSGDHLAAALHWTGNSVAFAAGSGTDARTLWTFAKEALAANPSEEKAK
ncbi:MAG: hypothetical protein AAB215_05095, partial [Planctomycetota bacterium]